MNLSDSDGEILVRMIADYRKAHEQRPSERIQDIEAALRATEKSGEIRRWKAVLLYLDEERS